VVDEYGEKPTFSQIVGRSFARIVPFEVFSCLGATGWHDDWSKTYVIRKKDLHELKLLISVQEFGKDTATKNNPTLKKETDIDSIPGIPPSLT
jgi:hypothetical protein